MAEMVKRRVVLHLAQSDQGGLIPFARRRNHLGDLLQFVVIAAGRPMAGRIGQKVLVVGVGIIPCVEKILYVIAYHPEEPLPPHRLNT